jgi:hypothetical protein
MAILLSIACSERKLNAFRVAAGFMLLLLIGAAQSCAPRAHYRRPMPPPAMRAPLPAPPPQPPPQAPSPSARQSTPKPIPEDPQIKEQNLPNTGTSSARVLKEPPEPLPDTPTLPPLPLETPEPPAPPPPLPDDSSLLAKITASTQPRRAASLRLTEEGRKLIDSGAPAKGLPRLEQSIAIDSSNPYGYFYLAKAHHKLGRHKESLNFLDVAEVRLSAEPYWLAEVYALRGENFRALGLAERAETSYLRALSINPGNRTAAEGLAGAQASPTAASR